MDALANPKAIANELAIINDPATANEQPVLVELVGRLHAARTLSVNVRRDAHHRGINDLEGENGERRTCWRRARMGREQLRLLPLPTKTREAQPSWALWAAGAPRGPGCLTPSWSSRPSAVSSRRATSWRS